MYKRGDRSLQQPEAKEERLMLLESWKDFEVSLLVLVLTLHRNGRIHVAVFDEIGQIDSRLVTLAGRFRNH